MSPNGDGFIGPSEPNASKQESNGSYYFTCFVAFRHY